MRDHSHHIQLTREEAVCQALAAVDALPGGFGGRAERVDIRDARGRVLARDVCARVEVPNCLTCCMDSIAVHFDDFATAGSEEAPGIPDVSGWERGSDWDFANTGTAMPEGFDTAVVVEHVTFSDDGDRVLAVDAAPSRRFAGTRPAGSSLKRGQKLAAAGAVVTPDLMARIVSGNVSTVSVMARPRVAFIPTGDELQVPGSALVARGKNVETNSILARAKVEGWGGEFIPFQTVRDRRATIKLALEEACEVADIVILNAGSSKGSADWSCEVLDEIGRVICHETNHGPGHHSSYTMVGGTPVVGISGPSGGASPTMDFYVRPLVRRFMCLEPVPAKIPVRLAEDFPTGGMHGKGMKVHGTAGENRPREESPDGFYVIRFVNVSVAADGMLEAHPVVGGPDTDAAVAADGYCMMPTGAGQIPPHAGDIIEIELRSAGVIA